MQARWQQQPDAEVVLRRATRPCPWAFGAVVPLAMLAGYGEEVAGTLTVDGAWRTLLADVPFGRFHYAPFTIGPSGAVRGQEAELGVAPQIRDLRYQRLGAEVVLSWSWPSESGTVDVRWSTEQRGTSRFRMTHQDYVDTGGCRIAAGPGEVEARVSAVVQAEGGECVSAPVAATVPALPTPISYTVSVRRPLVGDGTVTVWVGAEYPVTGHTMLVVAAAGAVMPQRPLPEHVLLVRQPLRLRAGEQIELTAPLRRLRRPFWIRCFLESANGATPARLIDPPISQLKVS